MTPARRLRPPRVRRSVRTFQVKRFPCPRHQDRDPQSGSKPEQSDLHDAFQRLRSVCFRGRPAGLIARLRVKGHRLRPWEPVPVSSSEASAVGKMEHVDITNLIVVAVGMAVAACIPALLPRLPVPGVVLEVVIGAMIGPQFLGWVYPGLVMSFLADFDLGMLFLMAGFEIAPNVLQGTPIGWFISAALAFAAALLLFKARLAADPTLTALSLSTTAIGALMPILRDSHLLVAPYGQTSRCGWTESVQHFWSPSSSSRREPAWTSRLCSQIRWPCPWCRSIRC